MIVGHTRTEAPVIGYRAFVATRRGLRALSSSLDYWPADGREAHCRQPGLQPGQRHQAPAASCTCGLYALSGLQTAARYAREFHRWRPRPRRNVVLAAVLLWGAPGRPVIVGELADRPGLQYRAPYGRVLALAAGVYADRAGRQLGVPVVRPDYLPAVAAELSGGVHLGDPRPLAAIPRADQVAGLAEEQARRRRALLLAYGTLAPLARLAWFLTRWSVRIAWWLLCTSVRLALLAVLAVLTSAFDARR